MDISHRLSPRLSSRSAPRSATATPSEVWTSLSYMTGSKAPTVCLATPCRSTATSRPPTPSRTTICSYARVFLATVRTTTSTFITVKVGVKDKCRADVEARSANKMAFFVLGVASPSRWRTRRTFAGAALLKSAMTRVRRGS